MKIGFCVLAKNLLKKKAFIDEMIEFGFNHIEIGLDEIKDWEYITEFLKEDKKISIGIHMPMEMNPCELISQISEAWISFFQQCIDTGCNYNIKYYNLHMGYGLENKILGNRQRYIEKQVDFFESLKIDQKKTFISIENTYSKSGDLITLGNRLSDFKYLLEKNKNLSFCYDVGHDLINKDDYIESLSDSLKIIHISTNDGRNDLHLGINKKGLFEISKLKKIIQYKKLEYIVLEILEEDLKDSFKILENQMINGVKLT